MRDLSATLLHWYDQNARCLPWRTSPQDIAQGIAPNPYHVWLSEIMLQQTTVAAVKDYFHAFTTQWPTVFDLASAKDEDVMAAWAGLGYYARARNLLKTARIIAQSYDGNFPHKVEELLALPGIGPYTSAAIASIAFNTPATVVDGNVERVVSRLFNHHTPLPKAKIELTKFAQSLTPDHRYGDYAQATMDLGATICTPKSPKCEQGCPWLDQCLAYSAGTARELPKKTPKKPKPHKLGFVFIAIRCDGAILLETRPEKGLLGGMLGFPTSEWSCEEPIFSPPFEARWLTLNESIRHTFTNFTLELKVVVAKVGLSVSSEHFEFIGKAAFKPSSLPNLMRKAFEQYCSSDHML